MSTVQSPNERHPMHSFLGGLSIFADLLAVATWVLSWFRVDSDLVLIVIIGVIVLITIATIRYITLPFWLITVALLGAVALASYSYARIQGTPVTPLQLRITSPQDGELIEGYRHLVQGHVSDPGARVRILVHPLKVAGVWVQDTPIIDSSGNWQVNAYFGTGNEGIGEQFEVIVLATKENALVDIATGNALPTGEMPVTKLPNNTNQSNSLTITRTR